MAGVYNELNQNVGGASSISSSISLIKTIIGAGLLSMPLAYSTEGIIFGTIIIIIAALTSGYGLFLQCYVSKYIPVGHATFFNLCSITYPHLSVIFDIAIAIQCFGCAVSYLVLIRDIMPGIITSLPYIKPEYYSTFWLIVSLFFTIPLSFLSNLDSLKYTSILALIAIFYMSILVVVHYFIQDIPREGIIILMPTSLTNVFSTFSIIVFAFTGHQNMFSIINEAKDKSLINLSKLINIAILSSSLSFIIVGLTGYLTFGSNVNGNIILSYPNGLSTTIGKLCIVFMITFSFPLMLHPARISINNIYYWIKTNLRNKEEEEEEEEVNESTTLLNTENDETTIIKSNHFVPFSDESFKIITISLLFIGYVLALSVKSFALVLAIVGATGSTAISFILPGLFGYKLIGSESADPTILEKIFKNLSLVLTIWGVLVMFLCLYSSTILP
ncbi:unnamed protein product [Candida verbasci]|uniref:Amino acid transporter transmembrane domain-containing protein n=1 Tax=Candida verbasci TaxID=1227364 RepID=A0A9W4XFB5_9ASCO|nr:unnamed protein product [Candida verbasci]